MQTLPCMVKAWDFPFAKLSTLFHNVLSNVGSECMHGYSQSFPREHTSSSRSPISGKCSWSRTQDVHMCTTWRLAYDHLCTNPQLGHSSTLRLRHQPSLPRTRQTVRVLSQFPLFGIAPHGTRKVSLTSFSGSFSVQQKCKLIQNALLNSSCVAPRFKISETYILSGKNVWSVKYVLLSAACC